MFNKSDIVGILKILGQREWLNGKEYNNELGSQMEWKQEDDQYSGGATVLKKIWSSKESKMEKG